MESLGPLVLVCALAVGGHHDLRTDGQQGVPVAGQLVTRSGRSRGASAVSPAGSPEAGCVDVADPLSDIEWQPMLRRCILARQVVIATRP